MKRDIITEINSIKSRSVFNSSFDYNTRYSDIEFALKEFLEQNNGYNQEFLKYIPVATVACFEGFFSSVIKELVDFGKPFSENIIKFNQSKNVKIDFNMLSAVQTKTLTIGDFVAHLLSYNNLEEINSNVSVVIDRDFLTELKNFRKESIFEHVVLQIEEFNKRPEEIFQSVQRTFEIRHIFCHEFATNFKIERDEIINDFRNCKLFLDHAHSYFWELLYPNSPETQLEMNIQSAEEYEKTDEQLNTLISTLKNLSGEDPMMDFDPKLFDVSQKHWHKYIQSYAKFEASLSDGGSMYPLMINTALTRKTKEKIKSLETHFQHTLRQNNHEFSQ